MKKKKLSGLSLNKKTVSSLSKSVQDNLLGGSQSCYTGTYPQGQCCGGGGGGQPATALTCDQSRPGYPPTCCN